MSTRYTGVLPLDRRSPSTIAEIVRPIQVGDELQLRGATWRVTQVIDEHAAYAGPVDPHSGRVRFDRAIQDIPAWQREWARQHRNPAIDNAVNSVL